MCGEGVVWWCVVKECCGGVWYDEEWCVVKEWYCGVVKEWCGGVMRSGSVEYGVVCLYFARQVV